MHSLYHWQRAASSSIYTVEQTLKEAKKAANDADWGWLNTNSAMCQASECSRELKLAPFLFLSNKPSSPHLHVMLMHVFQHRDPQSNPYLITPPSFYLRSPHCGWRVVTGRKTTWKLYFHTETLCSLLVCSPKRGTSKLQEDKSLLSWIKTVINKTEQKIVET